MVPQEWEHTGCPLGDGAELTCLRGLKIQNTVCAETYWKFSLPEAADISVRFVPSLDIKSRPIAVSSGNPHMAHRRHSTAFFLLT